MKTGQQKSAQGDLSSRRTDSRGGGGGRGEIYSPEKGLFLSAKNQLSLTMQNRMFISHRRTELGDEKQGCFEITGRYKNGGPEGGGGGRGKQRVLNDY